MKHPLAMTAAGVGSVAVIKKWLVSMKWKISILIPITKYTNNGWLYINTKWLVSIINY